MSIVIHTVILGALIYAATHASQIVQQVNQVTEKLDFIFLDKPKPGPGGGGGGRPKDPEPPRKAEIVAAKPPTAAAGAEAGRHPDPADGHGTDPDAAGGRDACRAPWPRSTRLSAPAPRAAAGAPASAPAPGPGVGEGSGGGFGGGVYQIGNGVTSPTLIREVKPNYTGDAMRAKLQGVVEMEAVVLARRLGRPEPHQDHALARLDLRPRSAGHHRRQAVALPSRHLQGPAGPGAGERRTDVHPSLRASSFRFPATRPASQPAFRS